MVYRGIDWLRYNIIVSVWVLIPPPPLTLVSHNPAISTKSKLETHSQKHIRKYIRSTTFQFLILSPKNQTKELWKSYSPKKHRKM